MTATKATLTSDADYYYLTYTDTTPISGTTTGLLEVTGGVVPISYLLVAGGGGTSGISNVGTAYTQWNCYYHSYGCDWDGNCFYYNYYCDDAQNISIYRSASGGAGGVHNGDITLNPGSYSFVVGKAGRGAPDGLTGEQGKNSSAFGAIALGGGAGIVSSVSNSLRDGGSGASAGGLALTQTPIVGGTARGNNGSSGNFDAPQSIKPYGNISCVTAVSYGYFNSYSSNSCYESQGTGGAPLGSGVGWGLSPYAHSSAPLGSQNWISAPTTILGITLLGMTVGVAGSSPDVYTTTDGPGQTIYPGSGAGTNQNSNQRATDGVIRIRIAKSTNAQVTVTS